MQVTMKRDNNGIHVGIRPDGATGYIWFTNNDGNNGVWDEVMVRAIQQSLEAKTAQDRQRCYNLGWKDKTRRNEKKTEFNECFNSTDTESMGW